jgi:hypothetical protein
LSRAFILMPPSLIFAADLFRQLDIDTRYRLTHASLRAFRENNIASGPNAPDHQRRAVTRPAHAAQEVAGRKSD